MKRTKRLAFGGFNAPTGGLGAVGGLGATAPAFGVTQMPTGLGEAAANRVAPQLRGGKQGFEKIGGRDQRMLQNFGKNTLPPVAPDQRTPLPPAPPQVQQPQVQQPQVFPQIQQPQVQQPQTAEDAWRNFSALVSYAPGTNIEQEKQNFMQNWGKPKLFGYGSGDQSTTGGIQRPQVQQPVTGFGQPQVQQQQTNPMSSWTPMSDSQVNALNAKGIMMKKGGKVKKMAKGGVAKKSAPKASSASKRGDGIAQRGKTKGRIV